MSLDNEARLTIEKLVDKILKEPEEFYKAGSLGLMEMGIQPSLETVLAFITGMLFGVTTETYIEKHKRFLKKKEFEELFDVLTRRAWEMRQEFMKMFYR